jgi:nickel/cobalt exporter
MISHTAVVWVVALGGQYLGRGLNTGAIEPYFQLASAAIVICIAVWMMWRTRREQVLERCFQSGHNDHHHHHGYEHDHGHAPPHDQDHHHGHGHHHGQGEEIRRIDTGHGAMALEVFEDGVPPRWRIRFESDGGWLARDVSVVTERPDRAKQAFTFVDRDGYLESVEEIPEPHEFKARVSLGHGGRTHDYDLAFVAGHGHDNDHGEGRSLDALHGGEYMDAHALAHANQISRRLRNREVTAWQIIAFGLTGGLVPCPAATTVLLLCLQLKRIALGVVLVGFFSVGLAIMMVMAGVIASLGINYVRKRWSGFDAFARRAPYASGVLMLVIAVYMGMSGWLRLIGTDAQP